MPEYKFLEGVKAKIAVTSGLAGADILMDEIVVGISPCHFIEVVDCSGDCINGGGQPRPSCKDYREKRAAAIYRESKNQCWRFL